MGQKGFVLLPVLIALGLGLILGVFLYPKINIQITSLFGNRDTPSSSNYQEEIKKPVTTASLQPVQKGGRYLQTPFFLFSDNLQKVEFHLPHSRWDFEGEPSFEYCGGVGIVCSYWVSIYNRNNPEYKLQFTAMDTSFSNCEYGTASDDNPFTLNLSKNYKTITTDFGTLRASQTDSGKYVICQSNVTRSDDKIMDWVSVTDIGFIDINTPQVADEFYLNEMYKILGEIEVTEFVQKK